MTETPEEQPENERSLTREDVLRLIEENGGTAQGLNLSGTVFQQNPPPSLQNMDLKGIVLARAQMPKALLFNTDMSGACLCGANLGEASLENTILRFANLQGANLIGANLQGARLIGAELSSAFLFGADIATAKMEFANWSGGYYVGEEKQRDFANAADAYRALRTRYTQLGMGDIAGEFFYWEMGCHRKAYWSGYYDSEGFWELVRSRQWRSALRALWPQRPLPWLGSMFLNCLFGYGERPWRVVGWWVGTIVVSSLAYFFWGGLPFPDALYYSLVSFPALGYGNWVNVEGWIKWGGPIEALWGALLVALFLTTFVRKMTR